MPRVTRRTLLATLATLPLASRLASAAAASGLGFGELYISRGALGLDFSEKVNALNGKLVAVKGFMAPPLKAEASFFVLTREPVSLCPFCDSDKDWPADILVVYLGRDQAFVQNNQTIEVTGRLEVGVKVDPETRFLSRLRLVEARFRTI